MGLSQLHGADLRLAPADMLALVGPGSRDGITPSSPVERAKQAIGLALAAERFGATFFGHGSTFGGLLSHPGVMSPEQQETLRASLEKRHQGVDRAHQFVILQGGMKFEKLGIDPEHSQFLETRREQINEIARAFNLPPSLIGGSIEGGSLTYQNVQAEWQRGINQCFLPWGILWEEELGRKLISPLERNLQFFEFTFAGLLRGDLTQRYAAYASGISSGVLTANEARAFENLPPLEAPDREAVTE